MALDSRIGHDIRKTGRTPGPVGCSRLYVLRSWWYKTTQQTDITTPTAELARRKTVFVGQITGKGNSRGAVCTTNTVLHRASSAVGVVISFLYMVSYHHNRFKIHYTLS